MCVKKGELPGARAVFMLSEPKIRPGSSQSTRSNDEAESFAWSEGSAGRWLVERTERPEMGGAPVSATATQSSDLRARWAWVEPAVWTDRMLSALQEGVK